MYRSICVYTRVCIACAHTHWHIYLVHHFMNTLSAAYDSHLSPRAFQWLGDSWWPLWWDAKAQTSLGYLGLPMSLRLWFRHAWYILLGTWAHSAPVAPVDSSASMHWWALGYTQNVTCYHRAWRHAHHDNLVSEWFTIHCGIGFPMYQLLRCGNCAVEQDCAYWEVRVCLGQSTCRFDCDGSLWSTNRLRPKQWPERSHLGNGRSKWWIQA